MYRESIVMDEIHPLFQHRLVEMKKAPCRLLNEVRRDETRLSD